MKTTVYLYNEYIDENGNIKSLPLSKPLKEDKYLRDILCSFKLDWIFKNSKYGKTIKDITFKARTYSHGSVEYNDIKMRMPGYTWAGTIKKEDVLDVENQTFYEKRKKRSNNNLIPNGLVCIEFDNVESNKVDELIQKALMKFPHLIYAGRTLSNKMFCMHRADNKLTNQNYIRYYKELAVLYYNELGIEHDAACKDISRCRYMCDQFGAKCQMEYCDFKPSNDIEVQYDKLDKIFNKNNDVYIKRKGEYIPKPDDNIYIYNKNLGFYYGHGTNHKMQIGEIIIPVPTITQIINTLLAIGKTRDEIIELWKTRLKYFNYNTNTGNLEDVIRLSNKFTIENNEYKIGPHTYLFLQMFFPDIVGCKSYFLAKNEFLCDRYFDFLQDAILTHDRILIHGDTGIGKTHFANRLNKNNNVIVIVPYIPHMDNYSVYEQIDDVNDIQEKISSCVVIWDRFIRLYEKGLINKNSIIIIDESHKLFLDQTYRAAAIKMNHILKEIKNHVCYISATPINEVNVDTVYRFEKERRNVMVNHVKIIPEDDTWLSSTLTINAILHLIYGNINYYDHIFIASDLYAQKIFDRLYGKYDCQLIRSSQKQSNEFIDLMKTQLLKHKIIIGTCISYEALNFNNKNEKILTITDMNEKTSAQTITQIAGRVRFSYNKVYLIDLIQTIVKDNYKEMAEFYNTLEKIKSKYNIYSKKHYVQTYSDELEDVSQWFYENNDIDVIKDNLPSYIKWQESEIMAHNLSENSPLNETVKDYIINYVESNNKKLSEADVLIDDIDYNTFLFFDQSDFIKIKENGQSGYIIREKIRLQQYEYNKLGQYIDYNKINNMIIKSHKMPDGVNKYIWHVIDIIKLNNNEYESYIKELETYQNNITYDIGYKILNRTIKEIKNIRNTYINCFDNDEFTTYNNVFEVYVNIKIKNYKEKQGIWKTIGKKTKSCTISDKFRHPEKYNLSPGQTFESCKNLADFTGKTVKTISEWSKKGWIL